ncbi:MAG TPA: DUF58 domain-containing protein [Thermoleophilia bacterium]
MRLRSIAWAGLAGLVVAAVLHSATLVFASLTASTLAALVVTTRRRVFSAFTFERTLSRRVAPWGSEVEITMSVTNAKLLPLVWVRVRDEWPEGLEPRGFALRPLSHLGRQAFIQTISVRWYERLRRRYRVRCVARGLHRFGPIELEAGDPFGIAGVEQKLEATKELAVLPRVLRVPAFDLLTGQPLVEATVTHSLAHDPTALRGTRAYRPGDPMRTINWRATARSGVLQTNEFDPASLAAVRLLVDVGSLHKAWEGIDPELMELLCVVAASLATEFADRGYGVGLTANARLTREWRAVDVPPEHGALPEVLETLARLLPYASRDFGSLLAAEAADESATADCVVVAAALRPGVRQSLARLRAERPTRVVYVGRPTDDEAPLVDVAVPREFEWRTSDALPLLA